LQSVFKIFMFCGNALHCSGISSPFPSPSPQQQPA
jgi:hypothetical protein